MADKKVDQEINKKTNKSIMDLIKETKSGNAEALKQEKSEIGKSNAILGELKKGIELQGGKAEDNKKFQMESKKIQVRELQLEKKNTPFFSESRKEIKRNLKQAKFEQNNNTLLGKLTNKLTGNKGAEVEKAKEQAAADGKQTSILSKIAGGIGGLVNKGKDAVKGAGKGFMSILKGTLLAGLFVAIAMFLKSPLFKKTIDFIQKEVMPVLIKFYDNVIKPLFAAVKDFVMNSLFPAIGEMFEKLKETYEKIKPSLTKLFNFLKETTLPVLMDTLKKNFETVKKIFMKIVDFVGNIISGDFSKAFDNLTDIGGLLVKAIDDSITGILKMVGLDFEGNVSDVIGRFFDGIFKSISDTIDGLLDSIENLIRALPLGNAIADSVFGEQTEEEKQIIKEKKKQVELAEKEEQRKEDALRILEKKKEINDQIEAEQARILRSKVGEGFGGDEYTMQFEKAGQRASQQKIDRLTRSLNQQDEQLKSLMPTAEMNKAKTDKIEKGVVDPGLKAALAVSNTDQSKKTINNVNSTTTTTAFVGNPSIALRMGMSTVN